MSKLSCDVAGICGGCSQVNVPYEEQLAAKDDRVKDLYAQFEGLEMRSICGMEDPYHYRNKIISPFAPGKRGPNGGTVGLCRDRKGR